MKKIMFAIVVLFIVSDGIAQTPGEWTWMGGSTSLNASGNFGTQGVPGISNYPPSLYEVANWVDLQGNFWLYGGIGGGIGVWGDLWKFNPQTLEWTWIYGITSAGVFPVYGIKGVASPTNNPGSRSWGIVSWTDQAGDLWCFGGQVGNGFQNALVNDLWKYTISSGLWTWMGGDTVVNSPGNFGIKGVPSTNNFPPSRSYESATGWIDNSNNLWLACGGYDDVWRYSIATNEWTWMAGGNVTGNPAVYGTQGIPDPANTPGARSSYTHWKDKNGNFWLFGGLAQNDMWKFDVSINQWAWMSGQPFQGNPGTYNSTCVTDTVNTPRSRTENKTCWTDTCGNFWMMGGNSASGFMNDLWRFIPTTLEWTWVNGSSTGNVSSVFGTLGVSSPFNVAGGRMGASGWTDANNYLWLFGGGIGGDYIGDFWRFVPDTSCTPCGQTPHAFFSSANFICPGSCIDFINNSTQATSYSWSFQGASPDTSTAFQPTNICYSNPGSYNVQLIASNTTSSDTLLLTNYITVYPSPLPQSITQSDDTLFAIAGSASYQWYYNGNIINGATDYFYLATQNGDYNVVATDVNGCEVEAAVFNVMTSVQAIGVDEIIIFPNPVEDKVKIQKSKVTRTALDVSVYNVIGEKMEIDIPIVDKSNPDIELDVHALSSGLYYLVITFSEKTFRSKFVKQ